MKEITICKCFISAGILDNDHDVVALPSLDDDPFLDADIQGLMERVVPDWRCGV